MKARHIRTKDIIAVLSDISSRYLHKPDVYNAISRSRQRKLNGLNEIELLIKVLHEDSDLVARFSVAPTKGDERDQDGCFMQGVFWAYRWSLNEFSVANDVLIRGI